MGQLRECSVTITGTHNFVFYGNTACYCGAVRPSKFNPTLDEARRLSAEWYALAPEVRSTVQWVYEALCTQAVKDKVNDCIILWEYLPSSQRVAMGKMVKAKFDSFERNLIDAVKSTLQ